MIQDITPHIYHNEYQSNPPKLESIALCYQKGGVLALKDAKELCFPRFSDLSNTCPSIYEEATYLFAIDGESYYLVKEIDAAAFADYAFSSIDAMRTIKPKHLAFAGITGYQLYQWYEGRRFCGTCGQPLKQDTKERMLYCEACHTMEYPKLSPAVIVAIRNQDKLLLSKYADRDYTRYALIAGFAEIGETIEETVHREVMEEVGLKVKNLHYYKSQPWSFSNTLLFGFFCDVDGSDEITLDEEELALAEWKTRDEIPFDELEISLTREMMHVFKQGLDPH